MKFTDAWTLPFKGDPNGITIYIWDSKGHMCFTYLDDDEQKYRRIIGLLNGEDEKPFVGVGSDGSHIAVTDDRTETETKPCLLVRGWGYLTGIGALNLDHETAGNLQHELMEYCMNKLIGK